MIEVSASTGPAKVLKKSRAKHAKRIAQGTKTIQYGISLSAPIRLSSSWMKNELEFDKVQVSEQSKGRMKKRVQRTDNEQSYCLTS